MVSPLPGAVGISGLRVYDWPTADGLCGGSPHAHLTCAEAYVVVAGEGSVQTLTCDGFAETPLAPGTVAWFTPGTVHRLVNGDGGLHIVVVMQNSGLPEAGDAVFTFPPETLNDPAAYERAAALDPAAREDTARRRRDLALEGYAVLRERLDDGDPAALHDFYRSAVRLKAHLFGEWEKRWRAGAFAEALQTGAYLSRLGAGDIGHLTEAAVHRLDPPPERAFGMCGRLDTYVP
ncbi:cupin domain-containing protein [Actinoallomurus rhizosphaericola]|uniref:cupin domain-containing protein n=1 Tax=Actinoallomurus rhizosphaericola TaxID=2952536 RepID=UPI00209281E4|nr:cupin [Actinoallomurus rhizosphaericola]MCO5997525.1 cupin [Actinoallomurus rhizosphaericola]